MIVSPTTSLQLSNYKMHPARRTKYSSDCTYTLSKTSTIHLRAYKTIYTPSSTEACTKCCCNPLTVLWWQNRWPTCEGTSDTSTALQEELDIYCVSSDHRSVSSETHFSKCCTEKSRQIWR